MPATYLRTGPARRFALAAGVALVLGLAIRYALLLGAGYVIIGRLHLHPLGVVVGVSAVVVAAMVEAVRSWRQPTGFTP